MARVPRIGRDYETKNWSGSFPISPWKGSGGQANWAKEGVDGWVSEKPLEMRHFWVLLHPEDPGLAPPGPPESFGMEKMRKTPPRDAVEYIIDTGPGWQNKNPG
jgi:hypothetical protein